MNATAENLSISEKTARFETVEWALRYAYICEAMQGQPGKLTLYFNKDMEKKDDFQLFMKKTTRSHTREEIIADGIMLKNTIMRYLDMKSGRISRWVIGARYRVPSDNTLAYLKQSDYESLAAEIMNINKNLGRKWFVVDVIRGAMEGKMHKSMEEWARHIGVNDKTVYRWAGSREPGYKSIKYLLSAWETEAMYYVTAKLEDMGELI